MGYDSAAAVGGVVAKAAQNAGGLEQSNQQMGDDASVFDVWTYSYDGMADRMRDFADDPAGALQRYDAELNAAVETGLAGDWQSSSMSAVGDALAAQAEGLGKMVDAIGEAEGGLATVGATFNLLTGVEQMLSTLLSVIPFPALPAIRVMDMDVGLPHAHNHPPNLVPPAPPVPLPSTGPIIPIPILSGASRTLINGMPAARCGDMGLGIWCGGYFPMFEVFLGSSNVWIEGARAGRLAVDITKHCIFTSPKPSDPPMGPMIGMTTMGSTNVLIGGVPMPSLLSLGIGAAMKGMMGGIGRALRRAQATRLGRQFASRVHHLADELMDAVGIRLGSRMRNRISRAICTLTGHPVDVATGKVFTDHVDFVLPGPLELRFERCWYSTSSHAGELGHGWHHTLDLALIEDPERDCVVVRLADGRHAVFGMPAMGERTFEPGGRLTLIRARGEYVLAVPEGLRYSFRAPRPAGAAAAPAAREWSLAAVHDRNDNRIELVRTDGRLNAIVDGAGRVLRVEQDAAGRITAILGPHPDATEAMIPLVRYTYDEAGDLVAATDAAGAHLLYRYRDHLLVKETDRFGVGFHFEYDDDPLSPRCVRTWGDGGIFDRRLEYDDDARVTRVTDGYGAVTTYHWNDLGLVEREIDALGNATTTVWSEHGRKLSVTNPLGHARSFAYDDRGRLIGITQPDGTVTTIEHDAAGNVHRVERAGAAWTWTHDERGNITSVTDPTGVRTRIERDARGLATRMIDPLGATTELAYDDAGNLVRAIDRAGLVMRMRYDRLGRVRAQETDIDGTTRFEWDITGNLVGITDALGNRTRRQYDAAGNLVAEIDPLGRTTVRRYAPAGPGGRLAEVIEPGGARWRHTYDGNGHLSAVTDVRGRAWRFERDPLGRLVREVDFDGHENVYAHDAAGRVTRWTTPETGTTEIRWDPCDRVVAQVYSDGTREEYAYDAAGRLTRAANGATEVIRDYDAVGRLIRESFDGRDVLSEYDEAGRRIRRQSPAGREVFFGWDAERRMTEIADPAGVLMRRSFDGFGREIERQLAGGLVESRGYAGRQGVGSIVLTRWGEPIARRAYQYDPAGNLDRIRDGRGSIRLRHDDDGRLRQAERNGTVRRLSYDETGNALGVSGAVGNGADPAWTIRRDRNGNIIEKSRDGEAHRLSYDCAQRLRSVTLPDGRVVDFTYDALGRRIAKAVDGRTTRYAWDADTLLSETIEADGETTYREYVFDGLRPLCVLGETTDDTVLLGTDHIERPVIAVDRAGRIRWTHDWDLPGIDASAAGGNGAGDGPAPLPLRFPGQQHDPETGLSCNRLRYYDPELNAYTQPDPVGLMGGLRPYNYVPDPNTWADPFGLFPHEMEGWIERDGQEVPGTRESVESGGLTKDEAGRWGLNSHTERKYLNEFGDEVRPGDVVQMRGELDPCQPGCRPAIRDFVDETGGSVVYEASSTGRTWSFRPAADGEFGRAKASVVLEVSENGKVVSRHRYYRSTSGRWVRRPC